MSLIRTQHPYAEPWTIDESRFPADGLPEEKLAFAVRYALLAPSGHNGQPWRFRVDGDRLQVRADRTRALPTIDPLDRELAMSCAAAAQFARTALAHWGQATTVQFLPEPADPDLLALIELDPGHLGGPRDQSADDLFAAMTHRHSSRHPYRRDVPAPPRLDALRHAAAAQGAWLQTATDRAEINAIADLIAEGDRVKWRERVFRRELAERLLPNHGPRRDGMAGAAFGVPGPVAVLAPLVVRHADLGRLRGRSDRRLAVRTPVLAVLGTEHDDPQAWLSAGRAMADVLLRATADGLATSFLCQAVEVPHLRSRLAELLRSPGHPQVLLRVGHCRRTAAPAPRRPLQDVLDVVPRMPPGRRVGHLSHRDLP